jgi:hypothetical protein
MRERDGRKALAKPRAAYVFSQCLARIERQPQAVEAEENDVPRTFRANRETELLVKEACACQIGDAKGDQADAWRHPHGCIGS